MADDGAENGACPAELTGQMQLKKIIEEVAALKIEGTLDRDISGIAYDSRRVTPGMIFVAMRGQNVDGHDFIPDAIERGAAAIVSERNGFVSPKATRIRVADSRLALAQISAAFYGHPARRLKMLGITGTNGKTTISFMLKAILNACGISSGLIGTIRYEIGARIIPAHRTTPEALEIHQMLAQMVNAGAQACVMEVSSHSLDLQRVAGIEYAVAIFTNLTQDHLDWHGNMENYYAAKEKLFRSPGGGRGQAAIINIDDAYGRRLHQSSNLEVKLTYGLSEVAQLRAERIELGQYGCRFNVEGGGRSFAVRLPLVGRHNIYNALAAIGAGLALKLDVARIQSALETMPPVPGRLESIECGQPFGVYIDYAHSPDALLNVLRTVRELTRGRVLLTFGCGGSRDKGKRPKMGAVAAKHADVTIITTDNPRKEKPSEIAAQIEQGYREARGEGCAVELDRRRAIEEILRQARPGDSVIIAGKGHETYQEFEDTVVPFDDGVHAREALAVMGFCKAQERRSAG